LLQRYQRSEEELRRVAEEWLECQKRIDAYVDEQVGPGLRNQQFFVGFVVVVVVVLNLVLGTNPEPHPCLACAQP
jgi:hypothetical protein